jgi:hypothetical protein
MRLLNLRISPQEWMGSKLKGAELDPMKFENLLKHFTAAMLYLNDGNVDAARSIARQFITNHLIKDIAEGRKHYEKFHEGEEKDLQLLFYISMRIIVGKREADQFYSLFIPKGSPDDDFKARRWKSMVDGVIARNNYLGDDDFLNIPYRDMDTDFFFNWHYYYEFAKTMLKKDVKRAKKLVEKLKEFIEVPENIRTVFKDHHFIHYIDMLEALAEVKPEITTKLIKDYQQWKEHVGW